MTPTQLKRIHKALSHTDGDVDQAAALLGVTPFEVEAAIKENPDLNGHRDGPAPGDVDIVARPPMLQPAPPDSVALAQAKAKADEQVRQGFAAIGVTGDALTQAMAFRDFGRFHFRDLRHFAGGGIAKLLADTMAAVQDTSVEIASAHGDVELQKTLREDRSRLIGHVVNIYDRVREMAVAEVVIEQKKGEIRAASERKGKTKSPAFPPLAMKVEGGNVYVNQPPQQAPANKAEATATAAAGVDAGQSSPVE